MSSQSFVNRCAHTLLPFVLTAAVPLAVGATGCVVYDDDGYYDDDGGIIIDDDVPTVGIDSGETLDAAPGEGVGVFVEYADDGRWNIWTTCDTEFSEFSCTFDIFIEADGLGIVEDVDLERGDFIEEDFDTAHIGLETDVDFDGFTFDTFNDEPVRIEVWLDGKLDPSFVFWVDGGQVWQGMPDNPTWFVPNY